MENHPLEITIETSNIHIENSYILNDEEKMFKILLGIKEDAILHKNIKYRRTIESWIREWKAHNLLYNIGFKKDRTGSVDLNEGENIFRLLGYNILSFIYDIFS